MHRARRCPRDREAKTLRYPAYFDTQWRRQLRRHARELRPCRVRSGRKQVEDKISLLIAGGGPANSHFVFTRAMVAGIKSHPARTLGYARREQREICVPMPVQRQIVSLAGEVGRFSEQCRAVCAL